MYGIQVYLVCIWCGYSNRATQQYTRPIQSGVLGRAMEMRDLEAYALEVILEEGDFCSLIHQPAASLTLYPLPPPRAGAEAVKT